MWYGINALLLAAAAAVSVSKKSNLVGAACAVSALLCLVRVLDLHF